MAGIVTADFLFFGLNYLCLFAGLTGSHGFRWRGCGGELGAAVVRRLRQTITAALAIGNHYFSVHRILNKIAINRFKHR